MRYRQARKLHNGDEVTVGYGYNSFKATVKDVHDYRFSKECRIDVVTIFNTYHYNLLHTDIH